MSNDPRDLFPDRSRQDYDERDEQEVAQTSIDTVESLSQQAIYTPEKLKDSPYNIIVTKDMVLSNLTQEEIEYLPVLVDLINALTSVCHQQGIPPSKMYSVHRYVAKLSTFLNSRRAKDGFERKLLVTRRLEKAGSFYDSKGEGREDKRGGLIP